MEKIYNSTIGREVTSEEIMAEIDKVMNIIYKDLGYYDINNMMGISFNSRLKRVLGKTIRKEGKYTMQFNSTFLSVATEENIKNVIAHECIHLVPDCWGHKDKFKLIAHKLRPYGYDIARTLLDENYHKVRMESKKEKGYYFVRCCNCRTKYGPKQNFTKLYKNIAENRKRYLCTRCKSDNLKVFHCGPDGIENELHRITI